ncbi:MAG: 2-C-methyl-D-erythritol 4-phosphate cytidylyltransferase [Desulfobacteraceae bacterium]|jgi:2-C-methyl-D-erythritol 4-phosphate cytidylyltransferase
MRTIAIIPAAGFGVRMKSDIPKQFLTLDGKPILAVTLEKFNSCSLIDGIILVVPADDVGFCTSEIVEKYNLNKVLKVTPGGKRRQDSVRAGIDAIDGECDCVLIHDGVRPFVNPDTIKSSIEAIKDERAVITAVPVKDTVKQVGEDGYVSKTYERRLLWLVQTPQVFRYDDIRNAHKKADTEAWDEVTDDAMLMEKLGIPVKVVQGSEENIKVTTRHDLEYAEFLLRKNHYE